MPTTHRVTTVQESGRMYFKDANSLSPLTTIVVGDSVEWLAADTDHSVESDNVAPFDTLTPPLRNDIAQGDVYSRTFATPGRYGYHCGVHGGDPVSNTDMYGIIQVNSSVNRT